MSYDSEATIQDADIELAGLEAAARHEEYLRKIGKCRHTWTGAKQGDSEGRFTCYHCGIIWVNAYERDEALDKIYGINNQ